MTTRTGSSSAMTSQAFSSSRAVAPPAGGSNVSGVSDADRMRSTLNVRRALRDSSQPIRYSAWVSADGSMASGWTRVRREPLDGS